MHHVEGSSPQANLPVACLPAGSADRATGTALNVEANVECYKCHAIRFYTTNLSILDNDTGSRADHDTDIKWDSGEYGGSGGTDSGWTKTTNNGT